VALKGFDGKHFRYTILITYTRGNLLSYVQLATSRQRKCRSLDEILGTGGNKMFNVTQAGAIILNIGTESGKHTG
jgi:hypothetical protein